jgi:hypothetical protein
MKLQFAYKMVLASRLILFASKAYRSLINLFLQLTIKIICLKH